jgi:hypothetical protein
MESFVITYTDKYGNVWFVDDDFFNRSLSYARHFSDEEEANHRKTELERVFPEGRWNILRATYQDI